MLMVVVLIGIIVGLAAPSMSESRYDRRLYDSAGSVMQLFREARARAMGRGGAIVLRMRATPDTDLGRFEMFEAVGPSPVAGINRSPVSTCKRGTLEFTTGTTNVLVASVDLNGEGNQQAHLETVLRNTAGARVQNDTAYLCYTPLGRVYFTEGSTASFDDKLPLTGALEILLRRRNTSGAATADRGLRRRVVVPPNGVARVLSTPRFATDPI
jgi:Tfp pilus assembly protein FimT